MVGPKLTTLIAYLKGVCHASFSTIRKFIRDVVGLTISRGQLSAIIGKVTLALEQPYWELRDRLPDEEHLNVDETGHKQNRLRMWTWCFRAELYTLFKIDPTRSTDVLIKVLGTEFDGVLGCDYFSSYRSYMIKFDVRACKFFLCQRLWERVLLAQLRAGAGSRFSKMMAKWFSASLHFRIGIVHFLGASWMAR